MCVMSLLNRCRHRLCFSRPVLWKVKPTGGCLHRGDGEAEHVGPISCPRQQSGTQGRSRAIWKGWQRLGRRAHNVRADRLCGCNYRARDGWWICVSSLQSVATIQRVTCPGCCFWEVRRWWAGVKGSVWLDGFPLSCREESQVHSSHPVFSTFSPETQTPQEASHSRKILLSSRFFHSSFDTAKNQVLLFCKQRKGKKKPLDLGGTQTVFPKLVLNSPWGNIGEEI